MAAARLDRAAGPRLHTRALRPGRLRADFPAGARGAARARARQRARRGRDAGAPARAGPGAVGDGGRAGRPRQRRLLRERPPAATRLRHTQVGVEAHRRARRLRLDLQPHGGRCGSWPTGRRRSRGPRTSSRSSCPTAASSIRSRWTAVRSPTRATRSCVTADRRDDLLVLLATALAVAVLLLRERVIAGAAGFPLDDSWIHLHFARNLAEGAGFAYNPGVPVAGSTAPLWTLLLAAVARAAGASMIMAKTLGVAIAAAAALLLRRAALAWGASPATALVAAIALAWSGPFAWGALSGMEVTLAALLVTVTALALARARLALAALAGGLAALARPETVVLLPFIALARRPTPTRLLLFAAIVIVVLVPFVAFCWVTTGTPV